MRGEPQSVSGSQVFPVDRKGWPGVGVMDIVLGSPVSLPPCDVKCAVLKEGSTAP